MCRRVGCFFFFNDTATTEIYTLSLHDALPILFALTTPLFLWHERRTREPMVDLSLWSQRLIASANGTTLFAGMTLDRKSTRLNSSHANISYAVFCLKNYNNERVSDHL